MNLNTDRQQRRKKVKCIFQTEFQLLNSSAWSLVVFVWPALQVLDQDRHQGKEDFEVIL